MHKNDAAVMRHDCVKLGESVATAGIGGEERTLVTHQLAAEDGKDRRTFDQARLQVHMNEYTALTTRATYFVLMSTAIWPLIFPFLALLATFCQHLPPREFSEYSFSLMVWVGGIGVQGALIIWTFLVCEQYKIVLYVETRLRPLVQELVATPHFWLYESLLKQRRQTWPSKWLELQTELTVFVAILVAVLLRILIFHKFTLWDWIGLALNTVMLAVLFMMAVSAAKIRQAWERFITDKAL